MGYRYSREEIGQVERLVSQGLTSIEIEDKLITLKSEKPELFYMTQAEQIGKIGALILKWLLT